MGKKQESPELKWLQGELSKGRVTRRDFMGRAVALGATTALATSLVSQSAKAAPEVGGDLKVGLGHGSTTDSLDPATYENGFMSKLNYAIHNHIAEVGLGGQLTPEIAESWEASSDAATWTFKIRQGVEFHNGKTVTAEDVVASVNQHRGEDSKSAAKPLLDQVEEIKADGNEVVVRLTGGNADFPFVISDYHIAIQPSEGGSIPDPNTSVGTGAYMLEDYDPGVRASAKRNPNYFKDGKGWFDSVELISIVDVAARTNALATGEIHVMDRCDLKTVHLLKRNPNLKVEETTGTLHYTFPMRTDTPPFDDNNIRTALKLSMDREEILAKVLKGFGALGNDHPISPSNQYHHGDAIEQRAYDPDKAKWHLKEAGAEGLKVQLSAADAAFAGSVDAAVLYKEHAAKSGIDIEVVREPNDGYWSNVWMNKPWCACYWGGRPTEDWMFSTAYAAGASWNDTFWEHERFNALLIEARAQLDQAKRREMYVEMQRIVRDEGGVLVPFFANYVFATANNIAHGEMQGNWDLDGDKFIERWWFG